MILHAIHTVPVWNDNGALHVCRIGEVRPDLGPWVIGWANILDLTLYGERRHFLLVSPVDSDDRND